MPELEAPAPLPARKKLPWWQPWFVVALAVVVVKLVGLVGAVLCVGAFFLVERRYGPVKGAGAAVLVAAVVGFVVLNGVAPKSMLQSAGDPRPVRGPVETAAPSAPQAERLVPFTGKLDGAGADGPWTKYQSK